MLKFKKILSNEIDYCEVIQNILKTIILSIISIISTNLIEYLWLYVTQWFD